MNETHQTAANDNPGPTPDLLRAVVGYLNFSSGQPDASFRRSVNELFRLWQDPKDQTAWQCLQTRLIAFVEELQRTSTTFADSSQALAVASLTFDALFPAYLQHHTDLLFHLPEKAFQQPLFLVCLFESVLAQGPPWDETDRIIQGALHDLNDFLGYRPLAVLENGRKTEPYPHERFRPIPLYIRDVGVAVGRYERLVRRTLELLESIPSDILAAAHFHLDRLDELALDLRAHDHEHPASKRTNYIFGEWDPHSIDSKGQYRRFVVRKIILDALVDWVTTDSEHTVPEECLYDASAVLCGTILMASAISGSGPDTHDSSVTLTSLLPQVAQQRDAFYERLLEQARGARARRLAAEARSTRQPFGHVRQSLNLYLARYGAHQLQRRHLAQLFARMGHAEASRQQASAIPCLAARFQTEIQWRITAAHRHLSRSELDAAVELLDELDDLLHRGIECGALMDPWNILGFQANFPLFSAREDSIPDSRVEILLSAVEEIFGVYAHALGEAAIQQNRAASERISQAFRRLADQWDQFATVTVEDLPRVSGEESWKSAQSVAKALSDWRAAGEAAGDMSFWREHVSDFDSARSYGQVVQTLVEKGDTVAAMGLLIQWLSQAEEVGFEFGSQSLFVLLIDWLRKVLDADAAAGQLADDPIWRTVCRLFDYLEANAGPFWLVPTLDRITDGIAAASTEEWTEDDGWVEADDLLDSDDEDAADDDGTGLGDPLYRAAYEDVVFRDSAWDGHVGDVLDSGPPDSSSEIEHVTRQLDPHLRFLVTLAYLWEMAATRFIPALASDPTRQNANASEPDANAVAVIQEWLKRVRSNQQELIRLLASVSDYAIAEPSGDYDSNVEYDFHLQTKFYLIHTLIGAIVQYRTAERALLCCLPNEIATSLVAQRDRDLIRLYRAAHQRDVQAVRTLLPKALRSLSGRPSLYISIENGGPPNQILAARTLHMDLRLLLTHLARLGLLRETWHVLRTAHRLERSSGLGGVAVTEFDRLFRLALTSTIESVLSSQESWSDRQLTDEEIVDVLSEIVDHYVGLWRDHSRNMRLSSAENLRNQVVWKDVKKFITAYGADLFHVRWLTLSNVRAILHNGVDWFLDCLEEQEDPLHPIALLDDLDRGTIDRDDAIETMELIYETLVDEFDRFLEYNTTTTQSDYGDKFYCLLEFLRLEAAYSRDAWNVAPHEIAHRVLTERQKLPAALIWEQHLDAKTSSLAETHLVALQALEERTGIHLPAISGRLNERFVRPLAVNRMLALVPQAILELEQDQLDSDAFQKLAAEIAEYLNHNSGSGIDVPDWLLSLEREVKRHTDVSESLEEAEDVPLDLPAIPVSRHELQEQLRDWDQPVRPQSLRKKKAAKSSKSKSSKKKRKRKK